MRRLAPFAIPLALFAGVGFARLESAPSCLDAFVGTWRGAGVVLGRPIVMQQDFRGAIGGAFVEQRMQQLASDTSTRALFEGRAFYRAVGARAPDSLQGTWFDSHFVTFVLRGACDGTTLSNHWSGVERGRTLYIRRGEELDVIDSVYPADGPGREFGRSTLRLQ